MKIPFNRPHITGNELKYIEDALSRGHLSGDGYYTKQCHQWLEEQTGCSKALLTHSCTAALEMAAILAEIKPGDEIIMPSFTFVSTANAFVLRGGVPVFVDIRPDTLNIDESLIEAAITDKTRAIVPVHYAGVGCEMDEIMEIAERYGLMVIEDAAQGIMANYKGKPLGSIGHMAALSFHETKNLQCGEGGALLLNEPRLIERAEIIREKGTNRSKFFRGEVDKYTWVDVGSSYLPSDIIAAFLYAQMECALDINKKRLDIWNAYYMGFEDLSNTSIIELPYVPNYCTHNAHMFYIKLDSLKTRTALINHLRENQIHSVFHYIPLHTSIFGSSYSRFVGQDKYTSSESNRLLRLPLRINLDKNQIDYIITKIKSFFDN